MQAYAKWLLLCSLVVFSKQIFAAAEDMKPFPPAEDGFRRMVIRLAPLTNEDDHKLELIIGKKMKVDCNRHWFGGQLTEEVATGWGFPYFVLKSVKGPASTLMACPPEKKEQEAFVQVQSDQGLLRYNSKLPVVVYVPVDFEVQYRIWNAKEGLGVAQKE